MDEQNNKRDQENDFRAELQNVNSSEEERLQYECEQAFLRLQFEEPSGAEEWKKFSNRIQQENNKRKRRKSKLFIMVASTAAVLVAAVFFWTRNEESPLPEKAMATIVNAVPEKQTLMIEEEISSKQTIKIPLPDLSKSGIEKEGIMLSSTEADYTHASEVRVRRNVVTIPRGQVYKIVLSDGTEVWMNASSSLSFPTRFSGPNRTVMLEGEAYFKVAHDEQHPFIIVTDKVTTEVLGTEFNVKAYKDSETHVTLVQGSVKVRLPQTGGEALLKPGDDITCTGDSFSVQQVSVSYYTNWMEGYFYYDNVSLRDILKDLGRWYNVTITMEKDSLLDAQRFHFVAERSENIDHVIENLNAYQCLSVTKDGENRITIRRRR